MKFATITSPRFEREFLKTCVAVFGNSRRCQAAGSVMTKFGVDSANAYGANRLKQMQKTKKIECLNSRRSA